MTAQPQGNPYPTAPKVNRGELPDPFALPDGRRIAAKADWPACAQAWRDMIVDLEYGGLPPKPDSVAIETLAHAGVRRLRGAPHFWTYRLHCRGGAQPFAYTVKILFPNAPGPFPAIVNGDGCWWHIADDIAQRVVDSGCALVMFNRTEVAEDLGYADVPDKVKRSGGLYDAYPGQTFGALAAWAWGYHRCVDLLQELPFIDSAHIAVTGLSRGGKAALLAGATDERIALTNDNASCGAGSPVFRYVGDGGETLNIIDVFPSWFGAGLRPYLGREESLPFDQHCLVASLAPRLVLLTFALDDRWSNPEGMIQSAWAAGEVYRCLDAPDNLAFHLRSGGHAQTLEDWSVLLDFIGWAWQGKERTAVYNKHPYQHLRPVFSWQALM